MESSPPLSPYPCPNTSPRNVPAEAKSLDLSGISMESMEQEEFYICNQTSVDAAEQSSEVPAGPFQWSQLQEMLVADQQSNSAFIWCSLFPEWCSLKTLPIAQFIDKNRSDQRSEAGKEESISSRDSQRNEIDLEKDDLLSVKEDLVGVMKKVCLSPKHVSESMLGGTMFRNSRDVVSNNSVDYENDGELNILCNLLTKVTTLVEGLHDYDGYLKARPKALENFAQHSSEVKVFISILKNLNADIMTAAKKASAAISRYQRDCRNHWKQQSPMTSTDQANKAIEHIKKMQSKLLRQHQRTEHEIKRCEEQLKSQIFIQENPRLYFYYQLMTNRISELLLAMFLRYTQVYSPAEAKRYPDNVLRIMKKGIRLGREHLPIPRNKSVLKIFTLMDQMVKDQAKSRPHLAANLNLDNSLEGVKLRVKAIRFVSETSARLLTLRYEEQIRNLHFSAIISLSNFSTRCICQDASSRCHMWKQPSSVVCNFIVSVLCDDVKAKRSRSLFSSFSAPSLLLPQTRSLKTDTNEKWNVEGVLRRPGIKVRAQNGEFRYFSGLQTRPGKYGFRLGTLHEVQLLKLTELSKRPREDLMTSFSNSENLKSSPESSSPLSSLPLENSQNTSSVTTSTSYKSIPMFNAIGASSRPRLSKASNKLKEKLIDLKTASSPE